MHPEIEKLIELALADGQVTERERNVILKKAKSLGVDEDEVEMILDGRIHQLQSTQVKPSKEKVGNIKTCPACGSHLNSLSLFCNDCGHEITSSFSSKSINELMKEIDRIMNDSKVDDLDKDNKISNKISHFPIPLTFSDINDFIILAMSNSTNRSLNWDIKSAWEAKLNEAFIKGKLTFKNNLKNYEIIKNYEEEYQELLKKEGTANKKRWATAIIGLCCLIVILLVFKYIGLIDKMYK